jgi:hypothetical protein
MLAAAVPHRLIRQAIDSTRRRRPLRDVSPPCAGTAARLLDEYARKRQQSFKLAAKSSGHLPGILPHRFH